MTSVPASEYSTQLAAMTASSLRAASFELSVPTDQRRALALSWLFLGLLALIGAGVFSILLVLSRTPYLHELLPIADFFRVALVVHVDLSVLVWFLAFGGIFWSINSTPRYPHLGWGAIVLAGAGALLMSLAPFLSVGAAIMSNYIPVLENTWFLAGLTLLGAGFGLLVARSMLAAPRVGPRPDGAGALRFGLNTAAVSGAVALLAFGWSYAALPPALDGKAYYELLFWGGGHVLQFTYTLLMMVVWLWLCSALGAPVPLSVRVVLLLFGVGLVSVFLTPVVYLHYPIGSVEHHRSLTWLMRAGGGLAIGPLVLAIALALWRAPRPQPNARPLRAALLGSLVLFSAGGLIGFAIHGSNVKIPAHYHGCIVGVTLALMGIAYHLLPQLGLHAPAVKWASAQAYLYAGGQLLHMIGLLWSGGYGVQRKVAGAAQGLRGAEEIAAMAIMGLGGLIAIIGGVLFVAVVGHSIARMLYQRHGVRR